MSWNPREEAGEDPRQLLDAYLAGGEGASERLCRALYPRLLPIACSYLSSSVWDPEDAVNSTLIAVLNYLADRGWHDQGPEAFLAFCGKAVKNRCLDMLRRESRRPTSSLEGAESREDEGFMDSLDRLVVQETERNLKLALERIDAPCRQLLIDFFFHKRRVEELRDSFGLKSIQAVYYRRDKCLERLRKILKTLD
jgi:RNA polymerase sigma factor (sigma-70 family)